MKKIITQRLMTIVLALIPCLATQAYDFEVDGLYYNILSASERTCEVTSGDNKHTGSVTIPAHVSYKNYTFTVTAIGEDAFSANWNLYEIVIPNTVNTIKYWAFHNCWSLTSVKIPDSVISIEWAAFGYCTALQAIEISNSVTTIKDQAFRGCSSLTSIVIPNSVQSIGHHAFMDCTALTNVVLGNSVKSIDDGVFENCPSLKSITSLNKSVPKIRETTFTGNVHLFATLYVPKGAKENYQAADYWKEFFNIEEINATGIQVIESSRQENHAIFDLQGHKLSEPRKGINIINGKKVLVK